jgi:hypothetical protein
VNLLRAGLVEKLEELNRSPWSGHSALAGYVDRHWQDTQYVLSFLEPLLRQGKTIWNLLNEELVKEKGLSLWEVD